MTIFIYNCQYVNIDSSSKIHGQMFYVLFESVWNIIDIRPIAERSSKRFYSFLFVCDLFLNIC